jgi:hypothetical protein
LPAEDQNLEFKYLNDQAKEKFKNRQRTLKKYRFIIEDDKKGSNISCRNHFKDLKYSKHTETN